MSIIDTAEAIHTRFSEFIQKVKDKYEYTDDQLKDILEKIDPTGKNKIKKIVVEDTLCEFIMKTGNRKGQKCWAKVKEGDFCTRHAKLGEMESSREETKLDYEYTAKLNRHSRYEFGKTGLIFKSQTEIYIIGKQLDNGSIVKLSEEDKELCKKHKLKYVKS